MTATFQGWLLSPEGAQVPASMICSTSSPATGCPVNFLMLLRVLINCSMFISGG
jgi:hypothetical protein